MGPTDGRPRPAGQEMRAHERGLPVAPRLRAAAEIFLRGPVPAGFRGTGGAAVGCEAIERVAEHLRGCAAADVAAIVAAVDWHRRVGSTASREAVIEAVTLAVASLPAIDAGYPGGVRDRDA